MTFGEAKVAMDQGKWVRRAEWPFMHRSAVPDGWSECCLYSPKREDGQYFEIYATMKSGELWPQLMAPTIFDEADKAAADWQLYEPPTGLEN